MDTDIIGKDILIPEKVIKKEGENKNITSFTLSPLESGFGTTIGNSLRRVLLSRIKGCAISAIVIPDVKHEFSTIDGVMEDVVEIVLNLKKLCFKKLHEEESEVIEVNIKKDVFIGSDINNFSRNFEVVNGDFEICHFSKNMDFKIKLYVDCGYGFEKAINCNKDTDEPGKIYIDAVYNPVKNVALSVNDIRVGNKLDYNSLTITVETDGTLTPERAIKEASIILIKQFELFSNSDTIVERVEDDIESHYLDIHSMKMKELLSKSITSYAGPDGDLNVRAVNCLTENNIFTLYDLVQIKPDEIMNYKNLGRKTLAEISAFLKKYNLELGMDLTNFKL